MYPSQTSFIPIQVALARFLESQGWQAIFANYPYWYLGTTPFRYLTGPVLPSILVILHRLLPRQSLFEIMFLLIAVCWMLSAGGVYLLIRELGDRGEKGQREKKMTAILSALFFAFGPIVPFLFRFSDGLHLIAFSFLPYVLLLYARYLGRETPRKILTSSESRGRRENEHEKRKNEILLCLLVAFVILLDSSIIPTLILGMLSVFLAVTGWRKAEERIKQTLHILILALLISTFWYSPGYWWRLLVAPSFAGKSLFRVIGQLTQLLPISLAVVLAVLSGKIIKSKDLALRFGFYWLSIFGFLTLIRFISDPDFWLDWTAYGTELQLGFAILGGLVVSRWVAHANETRMKIARINANRVIVLVVCCLWSVVWLFTFNKYVLGTLQWGITETVEYRIGKFLSKTISPVKSPGGDHGVKALLSGTTTFWLNAFFDIPQVRGGKDEVSVHPTWREAVWEIREGIEPEKSVKWLKDLDISYLVVHIEDSEEFYHDFKHPEKFENAFGLEKIYDEEGDRIYRRH